MLFLDVMAKEKSIDVRKEWIKRLLPFFPLVFFVMILHFGRQTIWPYTFGGYHYDQEIYQVAIEEENGNLSYLPRRKISCNQQPENSEVIRCDTLFQGTVLHFGITGLDEDSCVSEYAGTALPCNVQIQLLKGFPAPQTLLVIRGVAVHFWQKPLLFVEGVAIQLSTVKSRTWVYFSFLLLFVAGFLGWYAGWQSLYHFQRRWRILHGLSWGGLSLYLLAPRFFYFLFFSHILD